MRTVLRFPTSLGVALAITAIATATVPAISQRPVTPSATASALADNAAPLYDQAIDQLASPAQVMALLRMASTKPLCKWKSGDEIADVQRLGKLREIASIAFEHAERNLAQQRDEDAVRDLLMAAALGRHIGQTPLAIAKLVELGIEARSVEEIAHLLPQLSKPAAAKLTAQLDALPRSATFAEMLNGEFEYARDLARQGKSIGVTEATVAAAKSFYDKLAASAELPPDQFVAAADAALAGLPADQMFARTIAPALRPIRFPIAKVQAMDAMLRSAIAIAANGPDAVQQSRDPFGDGPFAYKRAASGGGVFTLSSKLAARGQNVQLHVGPSGIQ